MRKITWNKEAKSDYFENIDFLLKIGQKKKFRNLSMRSNMLSICLKMEMLIFRRPITGE